jgi:hypothetical protein
VETGSRQSFHVQLARDLLEHAPFLHARGILGAGELQGHDRTDRLVQAHAQQIDMHHRAAHGVSLGLLQYHRCGLLAIDAQIQHRAGRRERQAQLAGVRVKAHRLPAAAVHDAGHSFGATQASRRARAAGSAAPHAQLGTRRLGHRKRGDSSNRLRSGSEG